jgi:hypothetical protein
MAQTFRAQAELAVKLTLLAVFAAAAASVAWLLWQLRFDQRVGAALTQPIPFSHKHHVGDDGLDCRFCHATVETSAFPGLPSAQVCLTCHSQLFADQAVFAPLRQAAQSGRPIAWQHVYSLPDYVYFDHSVHVAKGVACLECHGRIDQMPLAWRAEPLTMKWCVECHRDPGPRLRPRNEVFSMTAAPLSPHDGDALARLLQIESQRRLTDCSTCHR